MKFTTLILGGVLLFGLGVATGQLTQSASD